MKNLFTLFIVLISSVTMAQEHVNLKSGYAAEGYDVVAYFNEEALKGNKKFSTEHEGINYKFSSQENLNTFKANPIKFVPQYGGFCAYAVAVKGEKIGVDPETYLIADNKLYLFYNSWGVNTLDKWNDEGPSILQPKADVNWEKIIKKTR